jgi:signal transduction histidine kinase
MNRKRIYLSRLYLVSLQQHLNEGPGATMGQAAALGHLAVLDGFEILDIARIHETAIATLILPTYSSKTRRFLAGRASAFFAEALIPIENTHRGAADANIRLNHTISSLCQRTHQLTESATEIKQEILYCTAAEKALQTSELTTSALLANSLEMQDELRHLSRQHLSVQEEERRKTSRELHDVIAQSLSSINLRLAEPKPVSDTSREILCQKIDTTQTLVEKIAEIVHCFARELRPSVLDDLGLIPAQEDHLNTFMYQTGVRAKLNAFGEIEKSENTTLTILYRIAKQPPRQRRAPRPCKSCGGQHTRSRGSVLMEITDDGIDFEVEGQSCAVKTIRLDLLGMKERIEMIGGSFCIKSVPGKGTTIRIEIPFTPEITTPETHEHLENNHHLVS